jgi:glycosyl transferase family 25
MFEFVEKIIYINLEDRKDRKEQIEKELSIFPSDKVIRFNAIKHEKGLIGCGASHIRCLQIAKENKWKNVLIVEDDMKWNNFEQSYSLLENLVKYPYDAIMLGGTYVQYYPGSYKLHFAATATAYLVCDHYYDTILSTFQTSLYNLYHNYIPEKYAHDIFWGEIQCRDKWYITVPSLCIQRPGYSDIENKDVDYSEVFI